MSKSSMASVSVSAPITPRRLKMAFPWILLSVVMAGVSGMMIWHTFRPISAFPVASSDDFPVLGLVKDFSLTDQDGHRVTRADLLGKIWIADLIFTRCQGQCPLMSRQMAHLQSLLPNHPSVEWVSISVNPDYDKPAVLKAYAAHFGAGPQWLFLTGAQDVIYTLARYSFKLGVTPEEGTSAEPISHSDRFVLIDSHARIRGYYDGMDASAVQQLFNDIQRLISTVP